MRDEPIAVGSFHHFFWVLFVFISGEYTMKKEGNSGYTVEGEDWGSGSSQRATGVIRNPRGRVDLIEERWGGHQSEWKS